MESLTYLKSQNADYIDALFERYSKDPDSVDASWRYFFDGLGLGAELSPEGSTTAPQAQPPSDLGAEYNVAELITAYRELGHLLANIDPLNPPPASHALLDLPRFKLTPADLEKTFAAGKLIGMGPSKLKDILVQLKEIYCSTVGVEYAHLPNPEERAWLQAKMEPSRNRPGLDQPTREHILKRLTDSESFERFLHTRYVAQKRFSIEGAEALIPSLDCAIEVGAELGACEFVMGMAHRGRLNVLTNTFGKKPEYIFTEFEGTYKTNTEISEGDVKYHMGYSADVTTRLGKKVHLSLANNPSHLEFVNPVVEGIVRAKQTRLPVLKDASIERRRKSVIPILMHGDAAFAGQGVCYETLNLAQLEGYGVGGTLHIVINNQVGFTTSPHDARSTTYSTDLAMMLECPIFHVNGDDPEMLWAITRLCIEYRQKFGKDAFIDLVCYRRHGHNEGDEPSFTQPLMYKKIKAHPTPREVYAARFGDAALAQKFLDERNATLTQAQVQAKEQAPHPEVSVFEGAWKGFKRPVEADHFAAAPTQVPAAKLREIAEKINAIPKDFNLHSKLARFFEARLKAVHEGQGIDWGNGEALAFATLVQEGYPVRLSGQDVQRGTFTHRHSVLNDFETGKAYSPLNLLANGQATYEAYNSHLSETGVLGFEYGYTLADPKTLVMWEAQFGDFVNGAQVIIDQFISSSESKWQRMSGLVMLLPHAFEGQGPEHSSARLERFLQLCGRWNLIVCNFTTPAQYFHALRRQLKRDFRKPLIVMTPKSLLRHPQAVSTIQEFSDAPFQEVLDDAAMAAAAAAKAIKRVVLCSGKVYYDLLAERQAKPELAKSVALIRVEQLYPWPEAKLAQILERYSSASSIVWAQEEPRNMGAWSYVFNLWSGGLGNFAKKAGGRPIHYVGREVGAAPAVGSHKVHEKEQRALIEKAFEGASS